MKILIVRIGAMGDVLHALPAVAALRRAHPGWQIDWVVDPRWSPILINSEGTAPIVDTVHLADTRLWTNAPLSVETLTSIRTLRRTLRAAAYDLVVDMQGTLRSAVIGRFAAAPIRAGYADPRESAATLFYTHKLPRRGTHVVEQGTALLSEATALQNEIVILSEAKDLHPTGSATTSSGHPIPHETWADAWAQTETAAGNVILLAPGAGWGAKQWPTANFAALAVELQAHGFDVVVNASRQDNPLAATVTAASEGAARTLVCSVTGLIALIRRAALVVGNDSGPTHLAAALGVPTLALFGPTDPARNGPWGAGAVSVLRHPSSATTYKRADTPDPGLSQVCVSEVLQTALKLANLRQ